MLVVYRWQRGSRVDAGYDLSPSSMMPAGNPLLPPLSLSLSLSFSLPPSLPLEEENRFDSHAHLESEYTQTRRKRGAILRIHLPNIDGNVVYVRLHV